MICSATQSLKILHQVVLKLSYSQDFQVTLTPTYELEVKVKGIQARTRFLVDTPMGPKS